jgi:adenine nucleotide transporter 17
MQRDVAQVRWHQRGVFRALRTILEEDGLLGLYRGLGPSVAALIYANFVYFFAYRLLGGGGGKAAAGRRALLVPALAGALNVLASCPVYVLSTKLRTSVRGSWTECARSVLREDGLAGFWRGLLPSLALVANPTIQYYAYERLKQLTPGTLRAGPLHHFLAGAASKTAATIATYPLQLAQTLLRAQRAREQDRRAYRGLLHCVLCIISERGVAGLYSGLGAKLWQTVLTSALHLALYERLLVAMAGASGPGRARAVIRPVRTRVGARYIAP